MNEEVIEAITKEVVRRVVIALRKPEKNWKQLKPSPHLKGRTHEYYVSVILTKKQADIVNEVIREKDFNSFTDALRYIVLRHKLG